MSEKAPEMLIDQLVDEYVEVKAEKMKRCEVPYDRLTIESNGTLGASNATVEHLFDYRFASEIEKQGLNKFAADPPKIWKDNTFIKTDDLTVTIKLKDGYPDLILTDYAIRTANDCPKDDPYIWFLTHGPRLPND